MSSTTFVDGQTVIFADWLNDVNDFVYKNQVSTYAELRASTVNAEKIEVIGAGIAGNFLAAPSDTTSGAWFVGSINGTTLTVSSVTNGSIAVGQAINDNTGATVAYVASGSGSTWTLNTSATRASMTMSADNAGTVLVRVSDGVRFNRILETDEVTSDMFGVVGSGDEHYKVQAMFDWAGLNRKRWKITRTFTNGRTLKIKYHGSRGKSDGSAAASEILFTGTGACVDFDRVGSIYPVSLDLEFVIRLTAANQIAICERYSYSDVRCVAIMNQPINTGCVGMLSLGDVSNGTGPYYNRNDLQFQGFNYSQAYAHITATDDWVWDHVTPPVGPTGTRGPNANIYRIRRSGQFVTHVLDQVGSGNTWDFGAVEGGTTAVVAGHQSNPVGLSQNTYHIRYLENTTNAFVSPSGKFGTSAALNIDMATGGGAVSDLATDTFGDVGILYDTDTTTLFYKKLTSSKGVTFQGRTSSFVKFRNPNVPGIELQSDAGNILRLDSNAGTSMSQQSARLLMNNTVFLQAGTGGVFGATDNTQDLGSSSVRWRRGHFGNVNLTPASSVTPTINGEVTFEFTNNTTLTVRARGSDGVVRAAVLTLS